MKRLLIVYHSQSGRTQQLAEACLAGAEREEDVSTQLVRAREADESHLFAADALLVGTPANFGYMSGALKDFFDRTYYQVLDRMKPKSYGLFISCENDPVGAQRSVERILGGLACKRVAEPVIAYGKKVTEADLEAATTLGHTLAAGLALGIY